VCSSRIISQYSEPKIFRLISFARGGFFRIKPIYECVRFSTFIRFYNYIYSFPFVFERESESELPSLETGKRYLI
jgi:hypothetical protein